MKEPRTSKRALVVEDEPLLAMEVAEHLTDAGFEVVGPATSVAKALRLLNEIDCDVAVLDVHLGSEHSEPVALALKARGKPFVVVSGNSQKHYPPGFQGAPSLSKPIRPAALVSLLHGFFDTVD
ncbi:MAG: response regulator [Hyphomicrobiaceae bacterium]